MNFKERKQLEENLLKNIYKNLRNDLEKIGETSFIYEDFGPEIVNFFEGVYFYKPTQELLNYMEELKEKYNK